jgi:putative addiction module killer protein
LLRREGWRRAPHSKFRLTVVVHRLHLCHARQDDDRLPGLDQRLAGPRGPRPHPGSRRSARAWQPCRKVWGSHRALRDGVSELKIDVGPGYRVYFTERDGELIILLAGGDKSTQRRDIERAIELAKNIP